MKKLIILLAAFSLYLIFTGCNDSTLAKENQTLKTSVDSLSIEKQKLEAKFELLYSTGEQKINDLKAEIVMLKNQIGIADTGAILRAYGLQLNQYLFLPLHYKLDSLITAMKKK